MLPTDAQTDNLKHLLHRMGFGPRTTSWERWKQVPPAERWNKLKEDSRTAPEHFDVADNAIKGLLMGVGEAGKMERRELDKDEKKQLRRQSKSDLQHLNLMWLDEMAQSKAQLREKMALFWHGHFASRNINILYQQQLLDIIRTHAIGNFGVLLREVSKSAAMISFLNNQQNKKKHPNENFAREVMELFTLGRGHYTETDIREAARAFTGWNHQLDGTFVFRKWDHDTGTKTVLGKTGNFDGDAVLDILLEQRQTAVFITRKLYKFLVNESVIPEERISSLADRFYHSGYDIMTLLDDIARSDWFYAPENKGCNIKSPVQLWVGIRRLMPLELADPELQITLQKALGQILLYPPNVAGWPGGRNWIDSSSLMLRLRIPQLLYGREALVLRTKTDDDQQMGAGSGGQNSQVAATIDWKPLEQLFGGVGERDLTGQMAGLIWAAPGSDDSRQLIANTIMHQRSTTADKNTIIREMALYLMSTPEFQLY